MTLKISRSHIQDFLDCERFVYLRYYHEGRGIVSKGINLDIDMGSAVHLGLAAFLRGAPLFDSVAAALSQFNAIIEQNELEGDFEPHRCMIEGLIRVWVKLRWPYFWRMKVLSVEKEYEISLGSNVTLMLRPDAILDSCILEFKTQSSVTDRVLEEWSYDLQIGALVLAGRLEGIEDATVYLEILNKGTRKTVKGAVNYYSPLLRTQDGENVWDMRGGVEAHIERMTPAEINALVFSKEISRSEIQLEQWLQTALMVGERILGSLQVGKAAFRARLDRYCFKGRYFKPCPYLQICFGEVAENNLMDRYQWRQPHHPQEFEV